MIKIYKIATGIYDRNVTSDLLNFNMSNTRGHEFKLQKERPRLDLRKYSFFYRTVDPWNSLPDDVVHAKTVNSLNNTELMLFGSTIP